MDSTPHTYIPQRIQGGSIKPDGFEVALREKKELIPWDKIKMVSLGLVEEPPLEIHHGAYMQLRETVRKFFAKGRRDANAPPRENLYLELFVEEKDQPYRAESTNINYRGFIEQVEHVSERNFKKFLQKLMDLLGNCEFNESCWAYVRNKKREVKRYGNVYEFQSDCQERWQRKLQQKD